MKPTTIIRDWWFIDFEHNTVNQGIRVAWGIVEDDPSCRWRPGDYCCTSPVLEEKEQEGAIYAITRNSIYQLIGPGDRITMPAESIFELRAGFSPTEISDLAELQKKLRNSGEDQDQK